MKHNNEVNTSTSEASAITDYLKVLPQYLLPHHALSAVMHKIARIENTKIKNAIIRYIVKNYNVDMSPAIQPDPLAYVSFNDFFTRALTPESRPFEENPLAVASPVDGAVSQVGQISAGDGENLGAIFQAKGRSFGLDTLLGGNAERAEPFKNGQFTTLYLSPRDYHRIHCPMDGQLIEMVHIPGRLFSVNPATTRRVDGLFARNERVAAIFETSVGRMAVVMVGAIFVSSIETTWAGVITPPGGSKIRHWRYDRPDQTPLHFKKGDELGRFNMGSTVVFLTEENAIDWQDFMVSDAPVKMGQTIAMINQ